MLMGGLGLALWQFSPDFIAKSAAWLQNSIGLVRR